MICSPPLAELSVPMSTERNVGVIGLGIIGSRVAKNLRKKGFDVHVWNRTRKQEENFAQSPADLAKACRIIQIFVSNDAAVLETIEKLKPSLTTEHLLTLHSTISPETAKKVKDEVAPSGARVVDAPFTGSKAAAGNGQLVYYLAGDQADLDRAKPVLEASSKAMLLFDKFGDASVVKIATNMISAAIVQALAEALAVSESSGVSPEKFMDAVEMNACRSGVSDLKLKTMLARDFEPHFSLRNMLKDEGLALQLGEKNGLRLPVTAAVKNVLERGNEKGLAEKDYSIVAELIRN
ncbi:MAG: NAD(P)-dependent oxidoreductase [Chthoniobacterales bacterium]